MSEFSFKHRAVDNIPNNRSGVSDNGSENELEIILNKTVPAEQLMRRQLESLQNLKPNVLFNYLRYCLSFVRSIYVSSPKKVLTVVVLGLCTLTALTFLFCISNCKYSGGTLVSPSLEYTLERYFPNLIVDNRINRFPA